MLLKIHYLYFNCDRKDVYELLNNFMNPLNKNVLFTVAYLNAMDFTPTTFEVWRHYIDIKGRRECCELIDVIEALRELEERLFLSFQKGFWKMGREEPDFFQNRILKQKISITKIKKIIKWNKLFRNIPFLRAVIFNGTLAMKNSNHGSDWDLLVIVKKDYIWLGRLFLSLTLSLFGKRRHGKMVKDRFCLNHYLTEEGLIFEEDGIFISNEIAFSFWMVGHDTARRFYQLNDFKNKAFLPNFQSDLIESNKIKKSKNISKFSFYIEVFLEKIGVANFLNKLAKKFMILKIKNNPKTKKSGADIRISDQALIFLPEPRRNFILVKAKDLIEKSV